MHNVATVRPAWHGYLARWPFKEPGWQDYSQLYGGPLERLALYCYAIKCLEYEHAAALADGLVHA